MSIIIIRFVTEPRLSTEQLAARTAQLRADADDAMRRLESRIEGVRQAQQQALRATGESTSRDGTVRAVVDATGVVTSLHFSPSTFEATTPERLAQTVVATIQSAATQARGRMSEALAPVRDEDSSKAVARGLESMGIPRAEVPAVPRTAADPTAQQSPWGAPQPQPDRPRWGAPAPDEPEPYQARHPHSAPHAAPPPSAHPVVTHHPHPHRPEADSDDDRQDWPTDERPW